MQDETQLFHNPYPGLRPFTTEESHLFFGREKEVDEVLSKLKSRRFVAIVGNSGIGKSSFVNCGVLPDLTGHNGSSDVKDQWTVKTFRPGQNPLGKFTLLFRELSSQGSSFENKKFKTIQECRNAIEGVYTTFDNNLLIYIDQFEEIFTADDEQESWDEDVSMLIDCILLAVSMVDYPIYFILTIRSDFVGDCSRFPRFTKLINDSQYLIPQMTKEEMRSAIVGPLQVMDVRMEDQLADQILGTIGTKHDQLPLMQHALMRTWDYWESIKVGKEPIRLPHYQAIGQMEEALSVHANEIFNALDMETKKVCERLFKCITEKAADGRSVRRPTSISDISEIANAPKQVIYTIVEHFRKPGRTLIMPASNIALTDDSLVDISHESLMRIWTVLAQWLEDEHEAIKEYLHICETAEMHQVGKATRLKQPELQIALRWRHENAPTKAWGIRHDKTYDRAMEFLSFSEKKFLQEQRLKERMQKLRVAAFKVIALVFGGGALIALGFFFYAKKQKEEAVVQQELATVMATKAQEQEKVATEMADKAIKQERVAKNMAEKAIVEQQKAKESAEVARTQQQRAIMERQKADSARKIAVVAESKAQKLRFISLAKSMAVKSLQESDVVLRALSVKQAHNYFYKYASESEMNDPDIYTAVYYALKVLKGEKFNTSEAHFDNVRSMETVYGRSFFYSAGSDGQIFKWLRHKGKLKPKLVDHENGLVHKAMSVSRDGKYVAVGGNYSFLKLVETENSKIEKYPIETDEMLYCSFTPDNKKLIYLGSNKRIMEWDFSSSKEIAQSDLKVNTIDMDPKGRFLALGKAMGQVTLIDLKDGNPQRVLFQSESKADITSVKFSSKGDIIAVGDMDGMVRIVRVSTGKVAMKFPGHNAMVNEIAFSHGGDRLATASFDHTVRVWTLDNPFKQPILLEDHKDWVWSIEFSYDDRYLYAGCRDKLVRTWMLDINEMASYICTDKVVTRNFYPKEWEDFVAEDINYECTCNDLPPGLQVDNIEEGSQSEPTSFIVD